MANKKTAKKKKAAKQTTEIWHYKGRCQIKGGGIGVQWIDEAGDELIFKKNKNTTATSIGSPYVATVTRRDDEAGGITLHSLEWDRDGATSDHEERDIWIAEDRALGSLVDQKSQEKKYAANHELDRSIKALRQIIRNTSPRYTTALIAHIISGITK